MGLPIKNIKHGNAMKKFFIFTLLIFSSILFISCSNSKSGNSTPTVNLKDDFYEAVNYELLSSWTIPADKPAINHFSNLEDIVSERVNGIIEQVLSSNPVKDQDKDEYNIKALYETAMDWDKRNVSGFGLLQPYLDNIDAAATVKDLLKVNMDLNRKYGIAPIYAIAVQADIMNSNQNAYYMQVNFVLEKEEWLADNPLFKTSFQEYVKKLWSINDKQQNAEQVMQDVTNMMIEIAIQGLNADELGNPEKIYNPFTMSEIPGKLNNNITVDDLIQHYGVSADDTVIIVQTAALAKLAEYLTEDNLLLLKNYMKTVIYQELADKVGLKSYNAYLQYQAQIRGLPEVESVDKVMQEQIRNHLNFQLGRIYAKTYVNDEIITNISKLVDDIRGIYRQRINNLSWMGAATKAAAIDKLDKMQVVVGYDKNATWPQDLYVFNYTNKNEGGIYINNVLAESEAYMNYMFENKAKPVNKNVVSQTPQTINAFYSQQHNKIIILAGILQSPFYSKDATIEENIGGIGTIIAHEITHAFDNRGSLFDANGNLGNSWWTAEDFAAYEALQQKAIDYYNGFQIENQYVNGTLTLSENIADLGAVSCVTEYAKNNNYNLQAIYIAYARIWAIKARPEYLASQLLIDNHAPGKIRANAVLSATDDFYTAFDIKETDGMYKPKEVRPSIW